MTDYVHKLANWLDHNRYLALAIIVVAGMAVFVTGCQSTTRSLMVEGTKVARVEYSQEIELVRAQLQGQIARAEAAVAAVNAEIEAFNREAEIGVADLDTQDAARLKILAISETIATDLLTGAFTPLSAIPLIFGGLGVLGVGAMANKLRQDKVIEKMKNGK